jgi:hypothetical protein
MGGGFCVWFWLVTFEFEWDGGRVKVVLWAGDAMVS